MINATKWGRRRRSGSYTRPCLLKARLWWTFIFIPFANSQIELFTLTSYHLYVHIYIYTDRMCQYVAGHKGSGTINAWEEERHQRWGVYYKWRCSLVCRTCHSPGRYSSEFRSERIYQPEMLDDFGIPLWFFPSFTLACRLLMVFVRLVHLDPFDPPKSCTSILYWGGLRHLEKYMHINDKIIQNKAWNFETITHHPATDACNILNKWSILDSLQTIASWKEPLPPNHWQSFTFKKQFWIQYHGLILSVQHMNMWMGRFPFRGKRLRQRTY